MLIHMIIFIVVKVTFTSGNVGSTIFYTKQARTGCWNVDDVVKLRARKAFEAVIPHQVNPDEVDAKYIKEVLRYFRQALCASDKDADNHLAKLLKEAIADTIGGHLRSDVLPTVRFAYYAGYVPYRHARQIHNLLDEIKTFLNTQGMGWTRPRKMTQKWSNLTVAKILIGAGTFFDPCSCLITKRDSNSCIHLPTPKLDDLVEPAAVALPFKTGGLVSLTSPNSNNVLLKYYTTASRCILTSSPEKCRHSDFVSFNNELWHWMKREVAPHLSDEKLYAAYGGVLRIAAAVQNYGKGLSRRNLFDYQDAGVTKWHPWQTLTQSYVYINADWTPKIYVGFVLLTAITIYLIQICYGYVCGDNAPCSCKARSAGSSFSKEVAYANVESNIPAILPHQNSVYCSERKREKSNTKSKSASMGSIRTQKVYDLNENTEKMMAVIMSDNEDSSVSSQSQSSDDEDDSKVIEIGQNVKERGVPQLEASISQLKVDRTPRGDVKTILPTFSTSTVTHTDTYRGGPASESESSGTESSSSRSATSTSRRTRSSRDLAWAWKVISRHSFRDTTKSTSRTEFEATSYTTPPSNT